MKYTYSVSESFIFAFILLYGTHFNAAEVLKNNGTSGGNLDAQTLVTYGREFNNSLITLIGRVIENYHACTAWSEWSECGAKLIDYFSTRTRTRRCGGNETKHRDEIDTDVCEGRSKGQTKISCPTRYTVYDGFCLKLYMETKNFSDADAVCRDDGGYLVNIDSDEKYDVIKSILTENSESVTSTHIDGSLVDSRWKFHMALKRDIFIGFLISLVMLSVTHV